MLLGAQGSDGGSGHAGSLGAVLNLLGDDKDSLSVSLDLGLDLHHDLGDLSVFLLKSLPAGGGFASVLLNLASHIDLLSEFSLGVLV